MASFRRSSAFLLAAGIVLGAVAAVAVVAAIRELRMGMTAGQPLNRLLGRSPKAVVDQPVKQLGVIETPDEFSQAFVIRNEGDAPLQLTPGPSTCKCTVTECPKEPIPPGGKAVVKVGMRDATKHDALKTGFLSRGMTVLTNDPQHRKLFLGIEATVRRRLAAAPENITLSIRASDLAQAEKRSAETVIYSDTWKRFDLAVESVSRKGMKWRLQPAERKDIEPFLGRSGYRLRVTLPDNLPDGGFSETIRFTAKPAEAGQRPRSFQVSVQGSVEGRLTFYGRRLDIDKVLRLGVLQPGEAARESVLMKVNDKRPTLVVKGIEAEPSFLRVQVARLEGHSAKAGVYRIDVEVPPDAPSCDFAAARKGMIRLKTDHPRLPTIALQVNLVKLASEGDVAQVAGR